MENCVFCKISSKEIKSYILEETDNFLSFLDIKPHSKGHTLVIPKKHFCNFEELPDNLGNELVNIIKKIIILLAEKLNTKDFTIGINEGKLAGRLIDHLHIHIIPRFKNDGGGSMHSIVYNPPNESLEEIYKLIKNES
jgi:histidine triad (HIT) family protein